MKLLLTLSVFFGIMTSSFATTLAPQDEFYQPEFEFVSIQPICPNTVPEQAVCLAYGAMIVIKATLRGCLDTVEFFHTDHNKLENSVELKVVALAKWDADNMRVRCIRPNVVFKTISVPYMHFNHVEVINDEIKRY